MNFIPSLKDFKSLLGNVNDGNIVFTQDGQGLEKANHGNAISRKIYNYRQVPSDPVKNQQIRQALMNAISNSSEGRALTQDQLNAIRNMLGLGAENRSSDDLTRVELKTILDTVELMVRGDDSPHRNLPHGSIKNIPSVETNVLVKGQIDRLDSVGYDSAKYAKIINVAKEHTQHISKFMSADYLDRIFAKGFDGHSKKEMTLFVQNSAAHIQSQVFDKLLWKYIGAVENNPGSRNVELSTDKPLDEFLDIVHEMTVCYAEGKEPRPAVDSLLDHATGTVKQPMKELLPMLSFEDPDSALAIAGSQDLPSKGAKLSQLVYDVQTSIKSKFDCLVQALSSKEVGFERRQLKNFLSQLSTALGAEMQKFNTEELVQKLNAVYVDAFNAKTGAPADKQEAANAAADKFLAELAGSLTADKPAMTMLDKLSSKTLAACIGSEKAVGRLRQEVMNRIGMMSVDRNPSLDVANLEGVIKPAFDSVAEFFDVGPLARAIAMKLGFEQNDAKTCQKIAGVLANAQGETDKTIWSLRSQLADLVLTDPNQNVNQVALGLIGTNDDLVKTVKSSLDNKVDMDAIRQLRDNVFTQASELKASYDESKFLFSELIPVCDENALKGVKDGLEESKTKNKTEMENCGKRLKELKESLPNLETQKDIDKANKEIAKLTDKLEGAAFNVKEIEQKLADCDKRYDENYLSIVKDPVFRGKLVLAEHLRLLDSRPDEKALLYDVINRRCCITPENVNLAKKTLDELFADRSLNDIKMMIGYISEGYSQEDVLDLNHPGAFTFRKLYLDGQLNFDGLDPKPQKYLLSCIRAGVKNKGLPADADPDYQFLAPSNFMTQETFNAFYKEFREGLKPAIEKANQGKSPEVIGNILKEVGIEGENAPSLSGGEFVKHFGAYSVKNGVKVSNSLFREVLGYGTDDPKAIRNAFRRIGLTQKDLNSTEGWLKAYRLSVIVRLHGDRIDGAVEWAERVTGKSFDDIRFGDLFTLNALYDAKEPIKDPQDKLAGDLSTIAKFLCGQATLGESKLRAADMPALLTGLRSLAGDAKSVDLKLFGKSFSVSVTPNGSLTARLDVDGKKMSITVARPLAELIAQIENQVVDHADDYTADQLFTVLPKPPEGTDPIARPRELYSKALGKLLGLPSVNFAHLSTKELYSDIRSAIDPKNRANLIRSFETPPKSYNSAETVELQAKYLKTDLATRSLVKMPKNVDQRTPDRRALDFVAELVMNADTWAYDTGMKTKGARIVALIQSGGNEIKRLTSENPDLIKELPEFLRKGVGEILTKLAEAAALKGPMQLEACAALEDQIDAFVETSMVKLQADAKTLFGASEGDNREIWKKGLDEMSGADGLSSATSQGRFTKKVLDNYFVRCDPIERRAMLANVLRNTDKDSSVGKLVGETLKGAGPLLQKTLQGLSASTFGPETQLALKDMKSKLLPISDSVIQANLLELVRSSNGEILSVEVEKSLGQATVGQALLCRIRTKDHPVSGEQVVIKILRPNVQAAVQREYKLFLELAEELDETEHTGTSQQETFKGRYQTVLKEFDFTLESENIDLGMGVYDKPTATHARSKDKIKTKLCDKIHSMDRHHAVSPMTGMLVLQKIEGKPVDRLLEDSREEVKKILDGIKSSSQLGKDVGTKTTRYLAESPAKMLTAKAKLWNMREDLIEKHAALADLVDVWLEKALFGDGVFHNDLHPGNVMINGTDVSVIDFGNVARLSKDQQTALVYLFAAAMSGSVDDFVDGVKTLLGGKAIGDEKIEANVKATLTDIFAKGSGAADVLPRVLAALSVLKDNSVPIPEVVHNFAESMSRIQSVIDGVVDQIEEIESISDAMAFKDVDAAVLKPDRNKFSTEEMPCFNLFVDSVNAAFKSLGTPDSPYDSASCRSTCEASLRTLNDNTNENKFIKELNEKVFKREDGGVALLHEILDMFGNIPEAQYKQENGEGRVRIGSATEIVKNNLKRYEEAFKSGVKLKIADRRNMLQESITRVFKTAIRSIWSDIGYQGLKYGPIIHNKADRRRFVECVGASLSDRMWPTQQQMSKYKGIAETKFVDVMDAISKGTSQFMLGIKMNVDTGKFIDLKTIGDKLEDEDADKSKVDKFVGLFTDKLGNDRSGMSPQDVKSMKRLARNFRFPGSWKLTRKYPNSLSDILFGRYEEDEDFYARGKEQIDKRPVEEVRNVFQENLNALKKTLNTDAPTEAQIKFFAQLAASTTRRLSFGDTFRQYDEAKIQEIAGDSEEIKTFLTAYKEAMAVIIDEENRAA